MSNGPSPKVLQLPPRKSSLPRDTLVVEATFPEAVGSDVTGDKKVKSYLCELAAILGLPPVQPPVTHLSPKYGLSGWLPLQGRSAIHLYAWDEVGRPTPPFLSVDVSTPEPLGGVSAVVHHLQSFFNASLETIVFKTLQNPENTNEHTWRELAPHILRQRLSLAGTRKKPFENLDIAAYMREICTVLKMDQLSEPLMSDHTGWMHWETSGQVINWQNNDDGATLATDIYTCRAFRPEDAIVFTREQLKLQNIFSQEL